MHVLCVGEGGCSREAVVGEQGTPEVYGSLHRRCSGVEVKEEVGQWGRLPVKEKPGFDGWGLRTQKDERLPANALRRP